MKKGFACSRCGCCCRVVGQMVAAAKDTAPQLVVNPFRMAMLNLLNNFPFKTDESGKCEHLTNKNECAIYDNRPLVCNVDRLYKKVFRFSMSKKQFYANNHAQCDKIRGLLNEQRKA